MVILQNLWWLLVLIGVMIMIHELGHFWAARYFKVRVDRFSFGFGPRLFGFRRGETDFCFSLILFGGYVKMLGEQPGDENVNDPNSLAAKPRWQQWIIVFAGPAMNIVLAVALLTGLFMVRFQKPVNPNAPATVGSVAAGSPAAKAGVREGDVIDSIDGVERPTWEDILMKELASANRPLPIALNRGGQQVLTTVVPELNERTGVGDAGWAEQMEIQVAATVAGMNAEKAGLKRGDILLTANGVPIRTTLKLHEVIRNSGGSPVEILYSRDGLRDKVVIQPTYTNIDGNSRWGIGVYLEPRYVITKLPFIEALNESIRQNMRSATLIYRFLQGMIERRLSPRSLEGPIRIAQLSGEAAREGPAAFVGLMAMVSLNLALFNLLPVPILDGGRLLILLIEMLLRRDLSLQLKETVFKLGFVFLMVLVVFVLYNDISKMLTAG